MKIDNNTDLLTEARLGIAVLTAKSFFGKDCEVEHMPDGKVKVKSILKDGYCKGGQKLETLIERETFSKEFMEKKYNFTGYEIKSLQIDGVEIIDESKPSVFIEERYTNNETEGDNFENNIVENEAGVKGVLGLVTIDRIVRSDDLVILYHEFGHQIGNEKIFERTIDRYQLNTEIINNDLFLAIAIEEDKNRRTEMDEVIMPSKGVLDLYKRVVEEEFRASSKVIELMKKDGILETIDIDGDNIRKVLSIMLGTYISMMGDYFKDKTGVSKNDYVFK